MSSATSTEAAAMPRAGAGLQAWHVYLLASLAGATAAVIVSRHTSPPALILLSAAILAAGAVATALHYALVGFFGGRGTRDTGPLSESLREHLEREKRLVLRSIKELEFDHEMGKVSDQDFAEIGARLREHALQILTDLEEDERRRAGRAAAAPAAPSPVSAIEASAAASAEIAPTPATPVHPAMVLCGSCQGENDRDARFCKHCGAKL
jgi:hypothetical protein